MADKLLEIKDLEVLYKSGKNPVHAVNGISLTLNKGETLGLVGETGAGKTTTALAILRLLPERTGCINQGQILFEGCDLLTLSEEEMRTQIRGEKISMIFQDPMTSLNPVATVGDQIAEAIIYHSNGQKVSQEQIDQRVGEVLEMVGIPAARKNEYPHQFSGGMNYAIVLRLLSYILLTEGALLLLPAAASLCYGEWFVMGVFLFTAALSAVLGALLHRIKTKSQIFYMREGFATTALCWLLISVVGAVPFVLTGSIPNPVDAMFETVSGFTIGQRYF